MSMKLFMSLAGLVLLLLGAQASNVNSTNCFEYLLTRASVRPAYVQRYAAAFRVNGLSVDSLIGLTFLELVKLLQSRAFNITHAGDAFGIHVCLKGPCLVEPFCQNGGKCVFVRATVAHSCQCAVHYRGDRCEKKVKDRVTALEDVVESWQRLIESMAVTYTRWGRRSCNASAASELVYQGIMAGSLQTHKGSGANYLCLPTDPIYGKFKAGVQSLSLIYSVELEAVSSFEPYSSATKHDMPCAVCRTRQHTTQLMVPAKNVCPPEWTRQYHGYLAATSYAAASSSEYVCLDADPDAIRGSEGDQGQSELVLTEAGCSRGIQCGPYVGEKELTCAVCTR